MTDLVTKTLNIFNRPYYRQIFSLPNSIIHYIAKNPSNPKVYEKLVQSCKYFYYKNPIILFDLLNVNNSGKDVCVIKNCNKRIELRKDKIEFKFWITGSLNIFESTFFTKNFPKIYRCDAIYLNITSQNLTFDEFLFLSPSAQICSFNNVKIQYDNGEEVLLENIIKNMPKLRKFYSFSMPNISSNTVQNLLKIQHFSKISVFSLKNVSAEFDIQTFYSYLKTNRHTIFTLHFGSSVSEEFKDQLVKIIDEIIQHGIIRHMMIPVITYPQMGIQKFKNILRLCREKNIALLN